MVAYNFQARFLPRILAKTKQQTIRAIGRKRHAREGEEVQLQNGSRFKPVRLGVATAVLVDEVTLDFKRDVRILDGHLGIDVADELADLHRFAVMDGFADWWELKKFWAVTHGALEEFTGVRIYWGETFLPAPRDFAPRTTSG